MKNVIPTVVLMSLVLVQGSSLSALENVNRLDNEGYNVLALSTDIAQQTGDSNDPKIKDNRDVIGTILNSLNFGEDRINPVVETTDVMNGLKEHGKLEVNSENKVAHPLDTLGKIADIYLTITKHPGSLQDILHLIPEVLSVTEDLNGRVNCGFFVCYIEVQGFNVTVGYDAFKTGLYIYITFHGFTIMHDKIQHTGFSYCEPFEMLHHKVKTCIVATNVQLGKERACLDLGFTILGYSHTFPDMCLFGSR